LSRVRPHEVRRTPSSGPDAVGGLMTRLESAHIAVHEHRCVRVRNRNAACRACADACTSGCISYADGVPCVRPELCVGCGTCATACPTCALEARFPTDAALLSMCLDALDETGACVVAEKGALGLPAGTPGMPDLGSAVAVESVGRVDESLLASLAAQGATRVTLVHVRRPEPDTGANTARAVLASARALLDAWPCDFDAELLEFEGHRGCDGDAGPDASVSDEPTTVERAAFDTRAMHAMRDGTLPHFVPDRRERLLNALADLGEPKDPRASVRMRHGGRVAIDVDACASCRLCAVFCPTGALAKFDGDDGTIGIEHHSEDCVRCGCCQDVCRRRAIVVLDEVPAGAYFGAAPERIDLKPVKYPHGTPQSILNAWKDLTGLKQLYER